MAVELPKVSQEVESAQEEIKKLVVVANEERGGCDPNTLRRNQVLWNESVELYGEHSVAQLLPVDYVYFTTTIYSLANHRASTVPIRTEQELINMSEQDIDLMRGTWRPVEKNVIKAMQKLAIAKISINR